MGPVARQLGVLGLWCCVVLGAACSGVDAHYEGGPSGIPLPPPEADRPRHTRDVRGLVVSPDGATLATVAADGVHLWRLPDMEPLAIVRGIDHLEFARGVALDRKGRQLAVLNEFFVLYVWDRDSLAVRSITPPWGMGIRMLVGFLPDGSLAWVSLQDMLVRWQVDDDPLATTAAEIDAVGNVDQVTLADDGVWLLSHSRGPAVRVLQEAPYGTRVETTHDSGELPGWDFPAYALSGGDHLASVEGDDVIEATGRDAATPWSTTGLRAANGARDTLAAVARLPGGHGLAMAWASGGIEIWEGGALRATVQVGTRWVRSVFPRRILAMVAAADYLWLLLPEQKLLRVRADDWIIDQDYAL